MRSIVIALVLVGTPVLIATPAAARTASFRVVEAGLSKKGRSCTVKLAWEYAGEGETMTYNDSKTNRSFPVTMTGKGVRFFVYEALPGYNQDLAWQRVGEPSKGGLLVGTVDMVGKSTGMATLKFPLSKVGAKPGQTRYLVGVWQNGHQWGCDAQRKGGMFRIPAAGQTQAQQNSRLGRRPVPSLRRYGKRSAPRPPLPLGSVGR